MKRRGKAGSKAADLRRPKTPGRKHRAVHKSKPDRAPAGAGLQTQLDRLKDELSEAREQQVALAEVLQVISSSPGELHTVINAMRENAVRLCEARFGNLFLYDGEAFLTAALHGASPAYA